MSKFKLEIGSTTKLTETEETGTVVGRAEFPDSEPNYLLRYRAADGTQQQIWWDESAIEPA